MTAAAKDTSPLLSAHGITKSFGDFTANRDIDFAIAPGQLHALLGENGAGKSTFVKMIYGLLQPDSGHFRWRGAKTAITGPQEARRLGIGMVFQHFSLFDSLSVAENIALALPETMPGLADAIAEKSAAYGIPLNPAALVADLSVGERQRVEIMRCLLQDPSLLIMDEPTSVLTPQEAEQLFTVLENLAKNDCAVLFISHKLDEIKRLTSRATILRQGEKIAEVDSRKTAAAKLAEMMVGKSIDAIKPAPPPKNPIEVFAIRGLSRPKSGAFDVALRDISLTLNAGEILGIAGVAGNGQSELMAALTGEWREAGKGVITGADGTDLGLLGPAGRRARGLGLVCEERNGHAAVTAMTLAENALMTGYGEKDVVTGAGIINETACRKMASDICARFDVRLPSDNPPAASLSGGNLQKFVIGREIVKSPAILIVAQPTWGVDIGAARFIRNAIAELAHQGTAVIMISNDLEEIFSISHRIAVLHDGALTPPVATSTMTASKVGLLMGGSLGKGAA